ncbi:hypothetical protein [Sphingomonas crusticola]|uniref:hypothetical protein n=1 Tax=Sphingomonas crusticola TaxID=1697973 RepID=UPI0013C2C3EC|nr:hypothetical protein [Sphingomonas crusticola]
MVRATTLDDLATYLPRFLSMVGRKRWFKRLDQLDVEQRRSPFRWKIVADYHWLELAIGFQCDVLAKEGRLLPEYADMQVRAGLHFVATVVEVHDALNEKGKNVLVGRLRDALKAETGFAALYLEMDVAQRLAIDGFHLEFPDLEGTAQFDLAFSLGSISGEVECKSLSADAGRKIHRKDFYRFIEEMTPAFATQMERSRREIMLIELADRLSANLGEQKQLRHTVRDMLSNGKAGNAAPSSFEITMLNFDEEMRGITIIDQRSLNAACQSRWGPNCHAAGAITDEAGCLIVMRSKKEDDTSKPLLAAMRKAATQFSGDRPAFIAVQFDEINPADLMLPHVRRRAGLLSYALFLQYGAEHVNATCFSSFDGLVEHDDNVASPSFCVPNPRPRFSLRPADIPTFLYSIPDQQFADIIGAPLPAPNISYIPFDTSNFDEAS